MGKIWAYIQTTWKDHTIALLLIALGAVAFRVWLSNHDASVKADIAAKTAAQQIPQLQAQQTATAQKAAQQLQHLQKAAAAVKTPKEAVEELTSPLSAEIEPEPLEAVPVASQPNDVQVEALPLYQSLNECKQSSVQLSACTLELTDQRKIDADKDVELKALKAPSVFHRFLVGAKNTACAGIGAAAGANAGTKGAAIGAAVGVIACQMF